jgi:hypothetical protein
MIGCPIIEYAQQLFVDAQTGTTIDDIYTVTGIEHDIENGKFVSSMTLTPLMSYGKYFTATNQIGAAIKILGQMLPEDDKTQKPEGKDPDPEA